MDKYLDDARKLFPPSMDVADRALEVLHRCNYVVKDAMIIMSKLTNADVKVAEWSPEEKKKFEDCIVKYGHDLYWVQKEVRVIYVAESVTSSTYDLFLHAYLRSHQVYTKSMKDIVIYFYKWKRTERYQPVYSQFCEKYRPAKKFKALNRMPLPEEEDTKADADSDVSSDLSDHSVSDSDEDEAQKAARKKSKECSNCFVGKSSSWRVRPLYGRPELLCGECANYWLKYAASRPITETIKKHNREKCKYAVLEGLIIYNS